MNAVYLHLTGSRTRAEAAAAFRALPLRDRKVASHTCAGISYIDRNGMRHTMAWPVVNADPRRQVAA